MKGVVVYDTYYGNTKIFAEAIAEQLRVEGHEAELRSVRERYPAPPQGDIMFLGSPVRMGSASRKAKRHVKKLDKDVWKNKPIVVFTTTLLRRRTQQMSKDETKTNGTGARAASSETWQSRVGSTRSRTTYGSR